MRALRRSGIRSRNMTGVQHESITMSFLLEYSEPWHDSIDSASITSHVATTRDDVDRFLR